MKAGPITSCLIGLLAVNCFTACGSKNFIERQADDEKQVSSQTPLPEVEKDDFKERLKAVENADFYYIFVFRRKDKEAFTSEDKQYLRDTAPDTVNMWVVTGDKKAVIAGTNFLFPPENLENLRKRFDVEDRSPKEADTKDKTPKKKEDSNARTKDIRN